MDLESLGQVVAIIVAVVTSVVALFGLVKDRTGLHNLERLGAVVQATNTGTPERKLLEDIRNDLTVKWGLRTLWRNRFRWARRTITVCLSVYLLGMAWLLARRYSWMPGLPKMPDIVSALLMVCLSLAVLLLVLRAAWKDSWEAKERKRRGFPATTTSKPDRKPGTEPETEASA